MTVPQMFFNFTHPNPEAVVKALQFLHNLPIGPTSQCVSPWQAFLAQDNVAHQFIGPILKLRKKLFGMYGVRGKLVCFSKPMKETESNKNTSLLNNESIFRILRIHNVLQCRPGPLNVCIPDILFRKVTTLVRRLINRSQRY